MCKTIIKHDLNSMFARYWAFKRMLYMNSHNGNDWNNAYYRQNYLGGKKGLRIRSNHAILFSPLNRFYTYNIFGSIIKHSDLAPLNIPWKSDSDPFKVQFKLKHYTLNVAFYPQQFLLMTIDQHVASVNH